MLFFSHIESSIDNVINYAKDIIMQSLFNTPAILNNGISASTVGVNIPALKTALLTPSTSGAGVPAQLLLTPEIGVSLSLRTESVTPFDDDILLWHGSMSGMPDVYARLSVSGLREPGPVMLSGVIYTAKQHYFLRPAGDALVTIETRDSFKQDYREPTIHENSTSPETVPLSVGTDDTPVINVLALYPTAMKTKITGGEKAIRTTAALMEQTACQVFTNTNINARVSIIAVEEAPSLGKTDVVALMEQDVIIRRGANGPQKGPSFNVVSARRDALGADVVVLLCESTSENGGVTSVLGEASAIPEPLRYDTSDLFVSTFAVSITEGDAGMTFTHELGHLLGGKHSRHTQPTRDGLDPAYDYAHAYIAPDQSYVTVMGYDVDADKIIPAYSSADTTWQGKKLGTPISQPEAADVASLFRLTTRVMAGYRGKDKFTGDVNLAMTVTPDIGGTILPSVLGPYKKGTVVSVRAVPRAGHAFDHWLLDNSQVLSEPVISVTMDQAHQLQAVFMTTGADWYTVTADPSVAAYGGKLAFSPAQEQKGFPYGTEVSVSYIPAEGKRNHAWFWTVDGQVTGQTTDQSLVVLPEANVVIGVECNATYSIPEMLASCYFSNTTGQQAHIMVSDGYGAIAGKKFSVSVLKQYQGNDGMTDVTLKSTDIITKTDGSAWVTFDLGNNPESRSLYLAFDSEELYLHTPFVYTISIDDNRHGAYTETAPYPYGTQYIPVGTTPSSSAIKLFDKYGKKRGNTDLVLSTIEVDEKTGIALASNTIHSDASGVAVCKFDASSPATRPGTAVIEAESVPGIPSPVTVIEVVSAQLSGLISAPASLTLKVNESVTPVAMTLCNNRSIFSYEGNGLELVLTLDDGGTGLTLVQQRIVIQDTTWIFFTPAKKAGIATLTGRLETYGKPLYDKPIVVEIKVQ